MSHNHHAWLDPYLARVEKARALLDELTAREKRIVCDWCGTIVADDEVAEAEGWRWHVEGDELVPLCPVCSP